MKTLRLLPLLLALVTGGPAQAAPPRPDPAARLRLRLPTDARPTAYSARLRVVPSEETFQGEIEISLDVARPTRRVWLNASDLEVKQATALVAGKARPAKVSYPSKDFVSLDFGDTLPKGAATLTLGYVGKLSRKDSGGASAQKEGDDWYVFTHMEPIDARRIFPCFDEPAYKVPWTLALDVRSSDKAFANTPETGRTDLGEGMTRVTFATSKPLPSYLLAFAVGPFEVVDAGKSRVSQTPVRVITPKGMAGQARWAKESSAELLARVEEYFGTNYPYEKMDVIAVPLFGGAMENPGLVTFSSQLLLRRPDEESVSSRRAYANVAVHEFAHQWFGNLVTLAWWDDLWLNEAFATWMTPKIIESWQPGWSAAEDRVQRSQSSMGADSLVNARRIRQPIVTNDDMKNAFDGITYGKGAAVLHMFEQWIGPDVFQRGVRRYMKAHAHGNATAKDFLAALSAEAGRDLSPVFSTFLDQPGVPLVSLAVKCDGSPRLEVRQERYLPMGSTGAKEGAAQTWQLPLCIRYGKGTLDQRSCQLVTTRKASLPLASCPDRLVPNEGAAGYYRAHVEGPQLSVLLTEGGKALDVRERMGVLSDLDALVRTGKVPYPEALALVPVFSKDDNRYVLQITSGFVGWLRDGGLIPEPQRPVYARFIRDHFGSRARALGWSPKKGENEDTLLVRRTVVPLVANQGEDASLQKEAQKLAQQWVTQRKGVDPELLDPVLTVAAQTGDATLHAAWSELAKKEPDRLARRRLLNALGAFRDPTLASQGLQLTLDPSLDAREAMAVLWGATRSPPTRPVAWRFVTERFEPLVERLPRDGGASLPWVGSALCEEAHVSEVEAFFAERSKRFTGGPRQLAQAVESMQLCAAFKKAQGPAVARFFEGLPRG